MKGLNIISFDNPDAPRLFTNSLHHCGFVIVENAPVSQELIHQNYQLWQKFFLSENKHQYPWCNIMGDGFVSQEQSETAKGRKIKDLKEFFHVKAHTKLPSDIDVAAKQLFHELTDCGNIFLSWIEDSLPTHVKVLLSEPLSEMTQGSSNIVMRTIHYPPVSKNSPQDAIRAAAHEDINLLTVLPAATAEGLEVKDHYGTWHRLKLKPNQLVVNTGDMLKEATGSYILSTTHRVVNPNHTVNKSRLSMPLFLHPRPDVVLSNRYTASELLAERLSENGFKTEKTT
jgi:isopenicillin N synthase-like dioxygenase